MTVVEYQYFFWDEDKHHPSPKAHRPKFHSKLEFSPIVLEQRSGIKKSFWGWFKPKYKHNRRLSPNQFWLFGILHPELNKHVENKDHVCPLPFSEGMSLEVTWSGGIFNLQGAVPLPMQSLLGAPQAGGCSWHPPLECQTASFCGRHTEEEEEGFILFWPLWLYWEIRWRCDRKQDEGGERHAAKGPRQGVKPGAAAARTQPLLYQLS